MRAPHPLGDETMRLQNRTTGLDIVHADAGREHVFTVITTDHRHAWFDIGAYDDARNMHKTS